MNARHMRIALPSCGLWLLVAPAVFADPVGLEAEQSAGADGRKVYRIYVVTDNPEDTLLGVESPDLTGLFTDDPDGFFQAPGGGDTPVSPSLCQQFPDVCDDSHVTTGPSNESTGTAPNWDSISFNTQGRVIGTWYANPEMSPVHPDADGKIMIAQLTVNTGTISGEVYVYLNDGEVGVPLTLTPASPCPADVNGSGSVDVNDLLSVMTNWGPCPGCAGDTNDDDKVDVMDLVNVLGSWGPCP